MWGYSPQRLKGVSLVRQKNPKTLLSHQPGKLKNIEGRRRWRTLTAKLAKSSAQESFHHFNVDYQSEDFWHFEQLFRSTKPSGASVLPHLSTEVLLLTFNTLFQCFRFRCTYQSKADDL